MQVVLEKRPLNDSVFVCVCVCAVGYNFYGTERMYSGTDGREMDVDIFVGVVYYQRLRHMVYDKYQVTAVLNYWQIFVLLGCIVFSRGISGL